MIERMNFDSCSNYPVHLIPSFTKIGKISVNIFVSTDVVLDIFSYTLHSRAAIKI